MRSESLLKIVQALDEACFLALSAQNESASPGTTDVRLAYLLLSNASIVAGRQGQRR